MKINFNGTIEKDGKEWKVWTVKIKTSKVTKFYERHQSDNNYRWYYNKSEIFGELRNKLEAKFGKRP